MQTEGSNSLNYPKLEGVIRIASFDPARINFAHYVDDTPKDVIDQLNQEYSSLPRQFQRRCLGQMNPKIEAILDKLYKSGKRVHMGVSDLRNNPEIKKLNVETRKNIISHLQKYRKLWDTCDMIIIEQQYRNFTRGKRSQANITAIRVEEITGTWFLSIYDSKKIHFFESRYKTQMLGAPVGLNDSKRKAWAVDKNLEIHTLRGDQQVIDLYDLKKKIKGKRMNSEEKIQSYTSDFEDYAEDIRQIADQTVRRRQKFDDFSDACIQSQAFKFRNLIGCF